MPFSYDSRFRAHLTDATLATLLVPVLVGLLWMAFRVTDYIPQDHSPVQLMVVRGLVRTPFVFCLTCVFMRAFNAWEDVFKFMARELQSRTFEQQQIRIRKD